MQQNPEPEPKGQEIDDVHQRDRGDKTARQIVDAEVEQLEQKGGGGGEPDAPPIARGD